MEMSSSRRPIFRRRYTRHTMAFCRATLGMVRVARMAGENADLRRMTTQNMFTPTVALVGHTCQLGQCRATPREGILTNSTIVRFAISHERSDPSHIHLRMI